MYGNVLKCLVLKIFSLQLDTKGKVNNHRSTSQRCQREKGCLKVSFCLSKPAGNEEQCTHSTHFHASCNVKFYAMSVVLMCREGYIKIYKYKEAVYLLWCCQSPAPDNLNSGFLYGDSPYSSPLKHTDIHVSIFTNWIMSMFQGNRYYLHCKEKKCLYEVLFQIKSCNKISRSFRNYIYYIRLICNNKYILKKT